MLDGLFSEIGKSLRPWLWPSIWLMVVSTPLAMLSFTVMKRLGWRRRDVGIGRSMLAEVFNWIGAAFAVATMMGAIGAFLAIIFGRYV